MTAHDSERAVTEAERERIRREDFRRDIDKLQLIEKHRLLSEAKRWAMQNGQRGGIAELAQHGIDCAEIALRMLVERERAEKEPTP